MKSLLLKFAGPMQSWGTNSHFEYRRTDFYPSKSAVIGMIAASFGYRRDEDEKIQKLNELDFAVRIDQAGNLLRDYHIAQKFKDRREIERTYVTNRYYLEDAVFIVAISHRDELFLDDILKALQHPYFQPFLGRRALPLTYDFILKTSFDEPVEALRKEPWHACESYKKKIKKDSVILELYADSDLLVTENKTLRKDHVVSFSQKARRFSFRYESKIAIKVSNDSFVPKETTHDAFSAIGDDYVYIED